jgi:glucose dehydrogenase
MHKVLFACLGAFTALAGSAANANDELIKMEKNAKDWVMPAGNYANQRYSELKQITAANVGKLQVAWTFSTGVLRGHEGGPLIVGNMMYVHTPFPNIVYALDLAKENKIVWKYEPKQDPNVIPVMCCDTVNRGVAYADGKIFLHQADTTLVALDAKTGKVEWSVKNGDPGKGATGTSSHWSSRTRCWSASPAANLACSATSPPTTSRRASSPGGPIRKGRTIR